MITNLYRLIPLPRMILRLGALNAVLAVLQGLLLGCLIPLLRALLPTPDFAAAAPWLGIAGTGIVIYGVLTVIASPIGFAASGDLAARLRHQLMTHATTLPLGWFTAENKTRLARATTTDAGNIGHLAVTTGGPAITGTLTPLTIIAVTMAVEWRVALLLAVILIVSLLVLRRAGRISSQAELELDLAASEVASRAVEVGQAQPVLRAAGLGTRGTPRTRQALDDHREVYRRGLRRSALPDLMFTAVVTAGFVATLAVCGFLLVGGSIGVVDAIALLVLVARFTEPLSNLIELVGALHAMDNSVNRVRAILATPGLPILTPGTERIGEASLEFDDVTFTYDEGPPALRSVSFRVEPGSTTALVGPSGSGKSTIARLAARFFDPDSGVVRMGGTDLRHIDQEVLLGEIAIVFQDVYLLDDTIEENLRIARPRATWAELEDAAHKARLDSVIAHLPEGWRTRAGEGGSRLSGGERQRVALARAFLKDARVVLVDEGASALDPENERAISDAIAALATDDRRTVVVIAHRPATLRAADRVVALDEGAVVESGPARELRTGDGLFARLHSQYERANQWQITTDGQRRA
ncbi:ABC transporter ATP-binding protein [Spiractinospora alimapuensis]|uniref:ABC transporter ATP-binding protein n=1 Tax=Spiractinospora alimapuensis TaxID=2820884 RepID=UPI001F1AD5C6|nr:ABC transporter ATP-binding protein [Spiractinospora alimapuensis]QVQ52906.1 ABC transporter ATP-binding protein [Spiractinospora alimapuensis]